MPEYILGLGHRPSSSASSNNTTTLTLPNDEMKDIVKTVKPLEDSGLILKGVSETVKNEAREQRGGFLSMLLGTLGGSFFGNILTGRGAIAKSQGRGINRADEGVVRAANGNKKMDF